MNMNDPGLPQDMDLPTIRAMIGRLEEAERSKAVEIARGDITALKDFSAAAETLKAELEAARAELISKLQPDETAAASFQALADVIKHLDYLTTIPAGMVAQREMLIERAEAAARKAASTQITETEA